MALLHQYNSDNLTWAVWQMEESIETLLSYLPESRRTLCEVDLQGFISAHRKKEWLSVRVLLYTLVQEDKQICYSSQGKPFLSDHSAYISISHTKGYVAVMLSKEASVGIDIEQYGQRVHRVFDRFVRSDEVIEPYLGDTTWSMLLHWSAKEALYKCLEEPDADLRKLRLSHFVPQQEGAFQAQDCGTEGQQMMTVDYRIFSDFVLTWTIASINL